MRKTLLYARARTAQRTNFKLAQRSRRKRIDSMRVETNSRRACACL